MSDWQPARTRIVHCDPACLPADIVAMTRRIIRIRPVETGLTCPGGSRKYYQIHDEDFPLSVRAEYAPLVCEHEILTD